MKFLGYIFRNARRNPLRSILTIGSLTVCGFLAMVLFAFIDVNGEAAKSVRAFNRVVAMSTQGFGGELPIALVSEIERIDRENGTNAIAHFQLDEATGRPIYQDEGKAALTPMTWVGNLYKDDQVPFTQFAVDPETFFGVYDEYRVPGDQIKAFMKQRDGAIIGRKLALDKKLKIGDPLPLKRNFYPIDLDLTIVGMFEAPANRDERWCIFHWNYFNEQLRKEVQGSATRADNAGTIFIKCKSADAMPALA
jgi:putative ABC transport system permease protein